MNPSSMRQQLWDGQFCDWNTYGGLPLSRTVELTDETLRDGLQSPSVIHPPVEVKIRLLHLMESLGIRSVNTGIPAADKMVEQDCCTLVGEIARQHLTIQPQCAGRTLRADVERITEVAQKTGVAVEACLFIGSSPIRQYVEEWSLGQMLKLTEGAVGLAADNQLPVMFVTEDTTRARPETLDRLYTTAIECGARRICLSDTVGHATSAGVRYLVTFAKRVVSATGRSIKIDWHGHNDRGLALANALAAIEAGVDRVHATALGIGERSGNTSMELLLVNLRLLGLTNQDLTPLPQYCLLVAQECGVAIPFNYPVVGTDAFSTAAGVHAAAIAKAMSKGEQDLAEQVYSSIPASMVGRELVVEIGPLSGKHNVYFWLGSRGLHASDETVEQILLVAKKARRILIEKEVREIIAARQ